MHTLLKAQLDAVKQHAMTLPAGTPRAQAFLDGFGPIHLRWHRDFPRVTYGFLLFHAYVIKLFKATGGPKRVGGVKAYTRADFASFGWPYTVSDLVPKGDLGALRTCSVDVQNWHNDAHMFIGVATGVDMMDALTNINHQEFWRLHYFINQQFDQKLRTYAPGKKPTAIMQSIETQNHGWVAII